MNLGGCGRLEMHGASDVRERSHVARKNFGDASLHPRAFQTFCEEAYLFFFAFFFAAIRFSSPIFQILASQAGGARNSSPCIRTARKLVKRKVIRARRMFDRLTPCRAQFRCDDGECWHENDARMQCATHPSIHISLRDKIRWEWVDS